MGMVYTRKSLLATVRQTYGLWGPTRVGTVVVQGAQDGAAPQWEQQPGSDGFFPHTLLLEKSACSASSNGPEEPEAP